MSKTAQAWELLHLHGGIYDEDYIAVDVGPILGADGLTAFSKGLWEMSAHEYHAAPQRAEANGHLMVAAPQLLEACRAAVDYLNHQEQRSWKDTVKQLQSAIAKSEGRN